MWSEGASPIFRDVAYQAIARWVYAACATLFVFGLGRLWTQLTYSRRAAFRGVLATAAVLFFAAPLALAAIGDFDEHFLSACSPLFAGFALIDGHVSIEDSWGFAQGAGMMAAGALACLLGWLALRGRHPAINFHFELQG